MNNDNDLKFAELGQIVQLDFPLCIVSSLRLSHRGSMNMRKFPRLARALNKKALLYTAKNYELFLVFDNRMEQCCWDNIITAFQAILSNILCVNQPAIRCNNVEQCC